MARKTVQDEPAVRKGLLVVAGVAVGVALLAFIVTRVFLGGGGGGIPLPSSPAVPGVAAPVHTATPAPTNNEVTSGGRDPFSAPQGLAPVATPVPATSAPATPAPTALASNPAQHYTLSLVKVSATAMDLKFNNVPISNVHAGTKLPDGVVVQSIGNGCAAFDQGGQIFLVCQGQTVKR